jgi:hypothetical protein
MRGKYTVNPPPMQSKYKANTRPAQSKYNGRPCQKQRQMQGRIGEVPVPACRYEFFTPSLFAPSVLNGNPALRGRRHAPQEAARHE